MKRMIFTGLLVAAIGFSAPAAQKQSKQQPAPAAAAAAAQPKGPTAKSKDEAAAVMALQNAATANNPDAIIKAAEDLVTKFSDTEFKETAYTYEAAAYKTKNDPEEAQVYGEKVLQINPKSYQMTLLLGEVIGTHIGDHDLNRADEMTSATKYFNDTIALVTAAEKPNAKIADDQWAAIKKQEIGEAHNGLGLLALIDKKWDPAIAEFKLAVDNDPQDAYNTRLASAYYSSGKYQDAVDVCDKLLANPQLHPQIKSVVTNIKTAASASLKAAPPKK